MVGTIPCLDPASIVAHVSRFAGGQRSQAKWHEQLAFDEVDDPNGTVGRHERQRQAANGKDLIRSQ